MAKRRPRKIPAHIAGDLKIVEVKANCQFNVTLNDQVILKTDCDDESH
jgi:hypothetical protein